MMNGFITRLLATTIVLAVSGSLLVVAPAQADDMSLRPLSTSGSTYTVANAGTYGASTYGGYDSNTYTGGYNAYSQTYGQTPLRGAVSMIPKGTTMIVKLDQPLSSESSKMGDTVTATVENDVLANGTVVIPGGSHVQGQITGVVPTRHAGRHGEVSVRFYEVRMANGSTVPVHGFIVTEDNTGRLRGDSYLVDIAKGVGVAAAGTAIGAVGGTAVGGILGVAGTGAAMGTGIGAAAGIGYALARKGKEVTIPSGTRISVKMDEDASVTP